MVQAAHDRSFSCLSFDFTLVFAQIVFYHILLCALMLTSVEHHCQINIERISRKLVKRIINKLENLHISNIETFLPKLDDAPLEFCNR